MAKEVINFSHEKRAQSPEIQREGEKRHEELRKEHEKSVETSQENLGEVRKEIEDALTIEKERNVHEHEKAEAPERKPENSVKKSADASFNDTMDEVRSQLPASSRAFSRIIHNKTVEKVSEGVGSTVARPNAILSGAIFAFILTLGVYLLAKNLGYPLSGFETIAAFILGWALGVIYDFLKVMITGRT